MLRGGLVSSKRYPYSHFQGEQGEENVPSTSRPQTGVTVTELLICPWHSHGVCRTLCEGTKMPGAHRCTSLSLGRKEKNSGADFHLSAKRKKKKKKTDGIVTPQLVKILESKAIQMLHSRFWLPFEDRQGTFQQENFSVQSPPWRRQEVFSKDLTQSQKIKSFHHLVPCFKIIMVCLLYGIFCVRSLKSINISDSHLIFMSVRKQS